MQVNKKRALLVKVCQPESAERLCCAPGRSRSPRIEPGLAPRMGGGQGKAVAAPGWRSRAGTRITRGSLPTGKPLVSQFRCTSPEGSRASLPRLGKASILGAGRGGGKHRARQRALILVAFQDYFSSRKVSSGQGRDHQFGSTTTRTSEHRSTRKFPT